MNPSVSDQIDNHVCPHCARIHEVVPSCLTCDRSVEARRFWHDCGVDQGRRQQEVKNVAQIESLMARLLDLEGAAIRKAQGWGK